MPPDSPYTPDEIKALAARAGLSLTPQWCHDLIEGARFASWVKARLGGAFRGVDAVAMAEEGDHLFRPDP